METRIINWRVSALRHIKRRHYTLFEIPFKFLNSSTVIFRRVNDKDWNATRSINNLLFLKTMESPVKML